MSHRRATCFDLWLAALSLCFPAGAAYCGCQRSPARPEAPENASSYNGIVWPAMCFSDQRQAEHIFVIGDWGGVGNPPRPFDNTWGKRKVIWEVESKAQHLVAAQMKRVAATSNPRYVLNVGDNFYPGGVEVLCGESMCSAVKTGQWENVFEAIYNENLLGKPWLGTLGNHDYGGFQFNKGWDQAIAYTWADKSGRWVTPALYWEQHVQYCDFSVGLYFVDTNVNNAFSPDYDPHHNICSRGQNQNSNCAEAAGPENVEECKGWFHSLWWEQVAWLEKRLAASTDDWQIIVTHFPPQYQHTTWKRLSAQYGIDLIVTGHRHQQEVHYRDRHGFGDTAWIVSGGGGGITSEAVPSASGYDDQYGFMDLTISKSELKIEAWSHGGILRHTVKVSPRSPDRRLTSETSGRNPSLKGSYGLVQADAASPGVEANTGWKPSVSDDGLHSNSAERMWINASATSARRLREPLCATRRRRRTTTLPPPTEVPTTQRRRRTRFPGANCWAACGHKAGICNGYCGQDNACCKKNNAADPPECHGAYFPVGGFHTCVSPVDNRALPAGENAINKSGVVYLEPTIFDMQADLTIEDCYKHCDNKSGECEFCGVQKACCRRSTVGLDAPECRSAIGFLGDMYECVSVTVGATAASEAETRSSSEDEPGHWWVFVLALAAICCVAIAVGLCCAFRGSTSKKKIKAKRSVVAEPALAMTSSSAAPSAAPMMAPPLLLSPGPPQGVAYMPVQTVQVAMPMAVAAPVVSRPPVHQVVSAARPY